MVLKESEIPIPPLVRKPTDNVDKSKIDLSVIAV